MIAFRELALRRGPRVIFSGLDGVVQPGWKLAVVGRNGSGKSSLFAAISGQLESDAGRIDTPAGLRLASVAQETPSTPEPACDYVLRGDAAVAEALLAAEAADAAGDHLAAARAHQRVEALGGYDARARVGRLLHGLGFAPDSHANPVASFSGGWRARLNLARALMTPADLLLLDEPTNHLDLDAMLWLEQWLRQFPGVLMVISHDREFLDGVADHVLHLADGRGQIFSGNYSAFERQRAAQLVQQQAAHQREQAERAHLESFVERFRYKASKARQAQSRIKRLEKLAGTEAVRRDRPLHFAFPAPARVPQSMLKLADADIGYRVDEAVRPVLGQVNVGIEAGQRIGLVGANGAGKTTLVRALVGELALLGGSRTAHKDLSVGYFAQHTVEALEAGTSPLAHLRALDAEAPEQGLRDWLGRWHLGGERAFDPVEQFSGGERARLALALIAWRKPNLLVLDEPTNHLDMDMREALAEALSDYAGALLLVAHDRHLLGLTCESFWHVADGAVEPFEGDLDDYTAWLQAQPAAAETGAPRAAGAGKRAQQQRQQRKSWQSAQRKVERELQTVEAELAALEQTMADPATWQQATAELAALGTRQNALRTQKAELEERWLALAEQIEGAA